MFFHSKGKHKGYVSGWQTTQHGFVVRIKTIEEHQTAKTEGMEIKASESQRVSIGVVHKEGCWCTQMSILCLISVVVCIRTDGNRGSNAAKTENPHETALSELVDVGEASAQQNSRVNCEGHGVRVRKVERRQGEFARFRRHSEVSSETRLGGPRRHRVIGEESHICEAHELHELGHTFPFSNGRLHHCFERGDKGGCSATNLLHFLFICFCLSKCCLLFWKVSCCVFWQRVICECVFSS